MIYDREVLKNVLAYHYRTHNSISAPCRCGWGELGRSHLDHIADVYEESVAARQEARAEAEEWVDGKCLGKVRISPAAGAPRQRYIDTLRSMHPDAVLSARIDELEAEEGA